MGNIEAFTEMTPEALATLGAPHIVYIRPVGSDELKAEHVAGADAIPSGAILYAVHTADGTRVAILDNREAAFIAARQNDMIPVSVH